MDRREWTKGLSLPMSYHFSFLILGFMSMEMSVLHGANAGYQPGEGEVDESGQQKGDMEIRPSLRAFGRSASSKVRQSLDWNR